jgi:hypothetical protein
MSQNVPERPIFSIFSVCPGENRREDCLGQEEIGTAQFDQISTGINSANRLFLNPNSYRTLYPNKIRISRNFFGIPEKVAED